MRHHATSTLVLAPFLAALLHCGGPTPPGTGGAGTPHAETTAPSSAPATASSEASSETWVEEASAPATTGGKGTGVREYTLDVTKTTSPKEGTTGPTTTKVLRIVVRFPVPKVTPEGAREPHVINQLLWKVRKEIAQCFYKGPGKDVVDEQSMIGFLDVSKKGEVKAGGIESADDKLKGDAGFGECVMANVKGLDFVPAGDDVKIRFKLKLSTIDATGRADVKAPEGDDKK